MSMSGEAKIAIYGIIVSILMGIFEMYNNEIKQSINDFIFNKNEEQINFLDNKLQMVYVKGGTFQMGSNNEKAGSNEKPVHINQLSKSLKLLES